MRVFLCGDTGIRNRGCEAIIRSTCKILNYSNGEIYLVTDAIEQDISMIRELGINVIGYNTYPTPIHRAIFGATRRVLKKSLAGISLRQKPLFSRIEKGDVCLNIGGDTYCYDRPVMSIGLNRFTSKKGVDNILWCCSIEKTKINSEIFEDLLRYKYILAREQITYKTLLDADIPEEKVIKCCDPAFFMDSKETVLPDGFIESNTVGINISECVVTENNEIAYKNVINLIRYILNETDMSICLIPHVYNIAHNTNDIKILQQIYNEISSTRVSIIDRELNCEELKYIISKCRFFVGARTHATIAAYSTGVPTLVIGYSVKSKGIACDLFGDYKGYVLPYDELSEKNELVGAFKNIVSKEEEIAEHLMSFIPKYREQLTEAMVKVFDFVDESENVVSKELCIGCGVCEKKCPRACITLECDPLGFKKAVINKYNCSHCNLCKRICPCNNKYKDDLRKPLTYIGYNIDEEIRKDSSSGGIFTALACKVLDMGGVVFGAAMNENFSVAHMGCESRDNLKFFRKSKYVESDIGDTFEQCKTFLENGRCVFFTGTPCQIGALYSFLGEKKYENLITQDFVCHGVGSPHIWSGYLSYLKSKYNSEIESVDFRNKRFGWKNYSLNVNFLNGKSYFGTVSEDLFLRGFVQSVFLKESCYCCSFKNIHRQADITLADCWNISDIKPKWADDKGVSLIFIHSNKGEKIIKGINSLKIVETDFDIASSSCSMISYSTKKTNASSKLLKRYHSDNLIGVLDEISGIGIKAKWNRFKDRMTGGC